MNSKRYELLPFVGPPASLPLWWLFARLPFGTAAALWSALLVATLAIVLVLALRCSAIPVAFPTLLAAALASLGFGPITSDIALGQVALPAFACALVAFASLPKTLAGSALATLGAALQPNLALVLLSQVRRKRALGAFGIAVVAFVALTAWASGTHGFIGYLDVLRAHGNAERLSLIQITPAAIAYGFRATPPVATVIGGIVSVTALIVWIAFSRGASAFGRFVFACAILPFVLPFFHEHDLLVVFAAAIYAVARVERAFASIAICAALFAGIDWLGLAQRPDGTVQSLLLAIAALLAYAVLRGDLRPRDYVLPALPLLLLAAAGFAAGFHPAPIWPDAMRGFGAFATGASASSIWAAEQRATGLLQPNAFWALLRCCSLLGCALVAWATVRASSRCPERSKIASPARA